MGIVGDTIECLVYVGITNNVISTIVNLGDYNIIN